MRVIQKPILDSKDVYELCLEGVSDQKYKATLKTLIKDVDSSASQYDQKAISGDLYQIPANLADKDTGVKNGVTKKQLSGLYTQYMVPKLKPARAVYNELLGKAPSGKCPFCGYCDATTLDHFLPKAKFPFLTVVPINLVPSCKDCNSDKNADVAVNAGDQMLHPYYDHNALTGEKWVSARVSRLSPASVEFYVDPPAHWDPTLKLRVAAHFRDNKLANRFAIQAADQLSTLRGTLGIYHDAQGVEGVQFHLNAQAGAERAKYVNSWQSAMFTALANDDWFCDGGYA